EAPAVSDGGSSVYSPTAEYGEPYRESEAYDLPQPSRRRRARWFILTLSALVMVIVIAAGLLLVNSITASENRRLKSAQKDYADAKYALAGEEVTERTEKRRERRGRAR